MKELKTLLKGLAFMIVYVIGSLLFIKTLWFPLLLLILGASFVIGSLL